MTYAASAAAAPQNGLEGPTKKVHHAAGKHYEVVTARRAQRDNQQPYATAATYAASAASAPQNGLEGTTERVHHAAGKHYEVVTARGAQRDNQQLPVLGT